MGKPSAPPAPDYKAAAQATASGNQNASLAAQIGNMTNQAGPPQYSLNERGELLDAAGNVTTDVSKAQQLGSTGVKYSTPAQPDKFGNMPFDQSTLTAAQKANYAATGALPKGFNVTYSPQQWSQNQILGGNDQTLFNQSQATQLGLSEMAVDALGRVNTAVNTSIAPDIAVQGGPASTADAMTTNIGIGGGLNAGRATGFADQDQVQRFVSPSGAITGSVASAGKIGGEIADAGAVNANVANAGAINTSFADAGMVNRNIADAGTVNRNIADAGAINANVANAGAINTSIADAGNINTSIANAGKIRGNVANAGKIASTIGPIGNITSASGANGLAQTTVDNNGNLIQLNSGANERASGLAQGQQTANQIRTNLGTDPQLLNQQTQDALYKANTQYLDPQFNQQQAKIENQLANQGITRGSEAYNNAMLNFNNQKQQAYESARNQAIAGSTAAAQGMFGMGLQSAQFGNQALGQQFGQYTTAQQLANQAASQNNANAQTNMGLTNAARGQQFGQGLQAAQFGNQAVAQNNANAMANAQFANTAQQQQYGQQMGLAGLTNTAQAQQYGQNANNTAIANTAQAQQYAQNANNATFGNAAQAQLYGQNANNAQFANAAQAQQYGQNANNTVIANAAQAQQYGQNANNAAFGNTAQAQQYGQNANNATFGNTAQAQQFGQNANVAQFANTAQAQQFGQNADTTKLGLLGQQQQFNQNEAALAAANAAQSQQYGQNLSNTNLANAAQNQQYNQNLSNAQFTNAAGQQYFNNNLSAAQLKNSSIAQNFGMDLTNQQQQLAANQANAALNNQALESQYNQALQSTQLNNQASNQQLAQNQAIQQNPLNILQAVRTGAQLNTANLPAVGVSQPGQLANWSGPDFLGAATAQGQYDQGVYNAKSAANSNFTGALIGAGGAVAGGALASDRRLKKNIKRIGTHILGIGLYTWDYLWGEPFAGVMADEVEQVMPEAIVMHPSGFKMVNYSMLGLV